MPNSTIDKIAFKRGNVTTTYQISNSVEGYLNPSDNKFYKESAFTTEIEGVETLLYVDLTTNLMYRYDTTENTFIAVSSSGGHIILNKTGTEMPERDNLQFKKAIISDDSINEKTIIDCGVQYFETLATASAAANSGLIDENETFIIGESNTNPNGVAFDYIYKNNQIIPLGGSYGHVIKDNTDTSVTQRRNIKFVNSEITDDSTNDTTIITNRQKRIILSKSEYNALPDSKLTDGIEYYIYDESSGGGGGAEDVGLSVVNGMVCITYDDGN